MIVTGAEVVKYSNISATATTITASGKIEVVQERIIAMCNNHFTTDMYLSGSLTFTASVRTIVSSGDFADAGFIAADDIYILGSYRNDGVYTVGTVATTTLTLVTGSSVVAELSGRSIFTSVISWPLAVKQAAALMIEYDYDHRSSNSEGLASQKLGPWSESYQKQNYGYPDDVLTGLDAYHYVDVI